MTIDQLSVNSHLIKVKPALYHKGLDLDVKYQVLIGHSLTAQHFAICNVGYQTTPLFTRPYYYYHNCCYHGACALGTGVTFVQVVDAQETVDIEFE